MKSVDIEAVNTGFGKMADQYDSLQQTNHSVQIMRKKFYELVLKTIGPPARMLELNCGSGIDARFFAEEGYNILATDVSDNMLKNARAKGELPNLSFKKLNLNELENLSGEQYNIITSNLGGLNCLSDLTKLGKDVSDLLLPSGYFIATVMPRLALWEITLLFKGEFKRALRRLQKSGSEANVGREKIFVKYYSPAKLRKQLSGNFNLISTKALRIFAPPPAADHWYRTHPKITSFLDTFDNRTEKLHVAAFACDYYIAVLQKK